MAVAAPAALANHSTKDHLSIGPTGGNGAVDVFFSFASADGARAFFETPESLVAADTDTAYDIYQRQGGTTTLISTGPTGGNGNFDVFPADVSADGSRVFFETEESLVAGDTDGFFDIYERSGGTTTLVSTGPAGGNGPFDAFFHDISSDGTRVFFETEEQLVAGDTDSQADVYERTSGTTTLVSDRARRATATSPPCSPASRQDGTRVFFETDEQLVASDTDNAFDVYRRQSGTTTLLSTGPPGGNGPLDATFRGSSLDGTRVFFQTDEVAVGLRHRREQRCLRALGRTTTLISAPGNGAFPATFEGNSGDGTRVFFETREALVAPGHRHVPSTSTSGRAERPRWCPPARPGNGSFDARFTRELLGRQRWCSSRPASRSPPATPTPRSTCTSAHGGTTTTGLTGPNGGNGRDRRELRGSLPGRHEGGGRDDRVAGRHATPTRSTTCTSATPARPRTSPTARPAATRRSRRSSRAYPMPARGSSSTRASRC